MCVCVLYVLVSIVSFPRLVQSQESELTYTGSQKAPPIQVREREREREREGGMKGEERKEREGERESSHISLKFICC